MSLKLLALRKLIDMKGEGIKQELLDGAKSGMRDRVLELRRKGQTPTVSYVMTQVNQQDFLSVVSKAGITLDNFKTMAEEVVNEEFSVKELNNKTGRNESCPCSSGKKFKKCCGKQQ